MAHFTRHAQLAVRSTFSTSHIFPACQYRTQQAAVKMADSVVMLGGDIAELNGWFLLRMEEREVIGVASVNKEWIQIPELRVWILLSSCALLCICKGHYPSPYCLPHTHFSQPIAIGLDFSVIGVSRWWMEPPGGQETVWGLREAQETDMTCRQAAGLVVAGGGKRTSVVCFWVGHHGFSS